MDAKRYLSQIRSLNILINANQQQLEKLWAMATKTTTGLHTTVVSQSGSQSKLEENVEKIILLQEEINNEIDRYADMVSEIKTLFSKLDSYEERLVLECRYIHGMSWEQTVRTAPYGRTKVYKLHKSGLEKVQRMLDEKN